MSHVANVEIVVNDLEALKLAAADCGLIFKENQKTFRWYGRFINDYSKSDAAYKHGIKPEDYGKCLHAISIPGNAHAYEVGVVANPNGNGCVLIWDFYAGGNGLQQHLGGPNDCDKLMNAYSKHVVIKQAQIQGFQVQETEGEDGEITLTDWEIVAIPDGAENG